MLALWSFAVKGFWVLWDNIYECVCVFTVLDFPIILYGQFNGVYNISVGNLCGAKEYYVSLGGHREIDYENSKVCAGKYSSDAFPVQNGLKQDLGWGSILPYFKILSRNSGRTE